MMAHSCSLLFAKQTHCVAMFSGMLFAGAMVLFITSVDRIHTSYPPTAKVDTIENSVKLFASQFHFIILAE